MPIPKPDEETRDEWLSRCIPVVLDEGTADDEDQAVAICSSMWADATKKDAKMHTGFSISFDVKALKAREVEGYGAIFNNVDLGKDVIVPGAFTRSLAEHKNAGTLPLMLWMHWPDQVLGCWSTVREDKEGLYVKGELADTQLGNETRTLLKMKAMRGLSIGYRARDYSYDSDGVRILKDVDLVEVSVVSMAMNPLAEVTSAKARLSDDGEYVPTEREVERKLREAGFSRRVATLMTKRVCDTPYTRGILDETEFQRDAGLKGTEAEAKELIEAIEGFTGKMIRAALSR